LATKTEENRKEIDYIVSKAFPGANKEEILSLEYVLLDGLKFHLHLFLPLHPLKGFVIDMQVLT
jgi:hypothetical protein